MRITTLMLVAVFAGCRSEADLVLELHRTDISTTASIVICDADSPVDCDGTLRTVRFAAQATVHRLGIYLDEPIAPPLSVKLQPNTPTTCRIVDVDPAAESDDIIVRFPSTDGADLVVEHCSTCNQRPCL